jgi:hypothetical protein
MRFGVGVRFAGVPLPLVASRTSFAARITAPNSWHAVMSSSSSLRTKSSSLPAGKTSISGKAVSRSRSNLNFGSPPVTPGYFSDQTNNNFTIQWDAVPTQATEDVFSGLSFGPATSPTGYACIVRFNTFGNIDARNGGAYAGPTPAVTYTANTSYRFRMVVRISNHTYDVYVTPQGQSEILLANNFAFRTENNTIATLDYLSKFITSGDATLTNMIPPPAMGLVPVVTGQTASLNSSTLSANEIVATLSALYEPTSWAITAGDPSGNFAVVVHLTGDYTADVVVSSAGATNLANQTGTATLTIRATNAFGNGANATVTVNYSAANALDIPLSFNDPMFVNMTNVSVDRPSFGMSDGQVQSNTSFTGTDNSIVLFDQGGTAQITRCRIQSNPACDADCLLQVVGNHSIIDHCYLDNTSNSNPTATHVDGIQLQQIPNVSTTPGTLDITHSMIAIGLGGGDVTGCLFCADNWVGTINLTNVIFQMAAPQNALIVHADTSGDINVSLNNVFFDIRGGGGPYTFLNFGGHNVNITAWNNVAFCTVNNGVFTQGAQIPHP